MSESKSNSRWKILQNAILNKKLINKNKNNQLFKHSVRSFETFGLFQVKDSFKSKINHHENDWKLFCCDDFEEFSTILIKSKDEVINLKDITSYNNTGNICLWPSEEVMAYYCLENKDLFEGKRVIELGGGKTSLAGVCLALNSLASSVFLTEGDDRCLENIYEIINENKPSLSCNDVDVRKLRWDDSETYMDLLSSFDFVICADCLFFEENHEDLITTILHVLKPSGKAFIFSPQRSNSLSNFLALCKSKLYKVKQTADYCNKVSCLDKHFLNTFPGYDPNLHFPYLIELQKDL